MKNTHPASVPSDPRDARIRACLDAVALGDALGATTEFASVDKAVAAVIRYRDRGYPFIPVGGGWLSLPPGARTDDTDMAVAIVNALRENGYAFDPLLVARNFAAWVASGPPDVGMSIRQVVTDQSFTTTPYAAAQAFYIAHPARCANGALMRNAVVHAAAPDLMTAFEWSLKQGILTHYAPLSVVCCAIQVWLIDEAAAGRTRLKSRDWRDEWWDAWVGFIGNTDDPVVRQWLSDARLNGAMDEAIKAVHDADFDPDSFNPFAYPGLHAKQGWVLLSLQIAVWAMQWSGRPAGAHPFPVSRVLGPVSDVFARREHDVIGWLPLIGHDSDTYGAIAGPMIAAACGKPFPEQMARNLAVRKTKWFDPI